MKTVSANSIILEKLWNGMISIHCLPRGRKLLYIHKSYRAIASIGVMLAEKPFDLQMKTTSGSLAGEMLQSR